MRHTCGVYVQPEGGEPQQCGKPAVDCAEIMGADVYGWRGKSSAVVVRIWMCAQHWDEWQEKQKNAKP